jgi:hypothetical protein
MQNKYLTVMTSTNRGCPICQQPVWLSKLGRIDFNRNSYIPDNQIRKTINVERFQFVEEEAFLFGGDKHKPTVVEYKITELQYEFHKECFLKKDTYHYTIEDTITPCLSLLKVCQEM